MTINEIATELEEEAKRLRGMDKAFRLPVQNLDINGARSRLITALPAGTEFEIVLRVCETKTYHREDTKTSVKWGIFMDYKTYAGATLSDAVNAALKSMEPEEEADVATEIKAVEEAFSEPLPM